jgi:hypothetical protein
VLVNLLYQTINDFRSPCILTTFSVNATGYATKACFAWRDRHGATLEVMPMAFAISAGAFEAPAGHAGT